MLNPIKIRYSNEQKKWKTLGRHFHLPAKKRCVYTFPLRDLRSFCFTNSRIFCLKEVCNDLSTLCIVRYNTDCGQYLSPYKYRVEFRALSMSNRAAAVLPVYPPIAPAASIEMR